MNMEHLIPPYKGKLINLLLDEADALKLVRLKVSAPFHSPLMEEARAEFSDLEFLRTSIF